MAVMPERTGSSTGSVTCRTATADDEEVLHRLDVAAWSTDSLFPSVLDKIANGPFFGDRCSPDEVVVAVLDGEVVGYARLTVPTPLPENAHVAEVNGFAVSPTARGRGVGRVLLEAAEQRARAAGAVKLSLRVLSTNAAARRLYERAGYVVEGRLRGEFRINGVDVDDYLLARYLVASTGSAQPLGDQR
jgi:ribosomal protein S18 acetylase RimI-like enzyme